MKRTVIGIALYPNYGSNLVEPRHPRPLTQFPGTHLTVDTTPVSQGLIRNTSAVLWVHTSDL